MYPRVGDGQKQLVSVIKKGSWDIPPVFDELIRRGADPDKVFNTFNMGIGFVLAVAADDADAVLRMFNDSAADFPMTGHPEVPALKAYRIGRVDEAAGSLSGDMKGSPEATVFES